MTPTTIKNLVCFSHLRWDFVFQRPQHLLTRFAQYQSVVYWEEPVFDAIYSPFTTFKIHDSGVKVVVPHINDHLSEEERNLQLESLLKGYLVKMNLEETLFWYYTPMALPFTEKFSAAMIVYDCMDELSAFKFAPEQMVSLEEKLMNKSDIVFTGGYSLYEAKKNKHHQIFPFPSSIDKSHFSKARTTEQEPSDQKFITGKKIGFFGVIDERFDIDLIEELADLKTDWQIILIGPVVKINPETLPVRPNIHYLGPRKYEELPAYLSGWDVALIPFAINKSTQFISPTKTPEYLSAGIPVVSTAIQDIVKTYGKDGLVHIGKNAEEFASFIELELNQGDKEEWLKKVNDYLKNDSWDKTFKEMSKLIEKTFVDHIKLIA